MANIIVKKYDHYNRAMGKHITSKRHYQEEMRKGGYVTQEEGNRLAKGCNRRKAYELSKQAKEVIKSAKDSSRNGKVKLGDRQIDAMIKMGAIQKKSNEVYKGQNGGFDGM